MKLLIDVAPMTPQLRSELAEVWAAIIRAELAERSTASPPSTARDHEETLPPMEVTTR